MRRGTTPTITVSTDFDVDSCKSVWFTLRQRDVEITKEKGDMLITDDGFSVTLTQEDTLKLDENGPDAGAQVRALTDTGQAFASNVVNIPIQQILKDGVIT